MRVASDQSCATVSQKVRNRPFGNAAHGQPAGERMAQRVPCHPRQTEFLYGRQIIPPIEVMRICMSLGIPSAQNSLRRS